MLAQALGQALFRLAAQLGGLVGDDVLRDRGRGGGDLRLEGGALRRALRGRRQARGAEARQDGLAGARPVGAAHRNLDGRLERVGQVAKQLGHLGPGLEGVARGQAPALVVGDEPTFGDGQQRVVRLVILGLGEVGLVRRHQREAVPVGEPNQLALDGALVGEAVALQLDVETVLAEGAFEGFEARERQFGAIGPERRIDRPTHAAGERDEAARAFGERLGRDPWHLAELVVEIGAAGEPQQVAVAGLVLGQQHDVRVRGVELGVRLRRLEGDAELHPGDRLDAGAGRLLGEFESAEQVVGVGERQGGLPVGARGLHEVADLERALEQGIRGVDVQVDVADGLQDLQGDSRADMSAAGFPPRP